MMITSKDLLDMTGLSRATLNNYISAGLLPKPEVKRISPSPGEPLTTLGYFPDWAVERIQRIQTMKKNGVSMGAIIKELSQDKKTNPITEKASKSEVDKQDFFESINNHDIKNKISSNLLENTPSNPALPALSMENLPFPSYLISYEGHFLWINEEAEHLLFKNGHIPEHIEDRSVFKALTNWSENDTYSNNDLDIKKLIECHFAVIKSRFTHQTFTNNLGQFPIKYLDLIKSSFEDASPTPDQMFYDEYIDCGALGYRRLVGIAFREGVLITYIPTSENQEEILSWLSQRDHVIRYLLSRRLPVLTPVAVLVADLQNSVTICSELPPDEYFRLINEIWSALDPIFRSHYGAYGKHTGDGMVYYFFPQPDSNYLMNSIRCANEIRTKMREISHKWSLEKGWTNQLYMNIGLSEGEEWLGTFKTNTNYELVVLGQTINLGARLSDFARFGKIWATKGLVSKLSPEDRGQVLYGVTRKGSDEEVFVSSIYAQVSSLIDPNSPRYHKTMDIASEAVTEIKSVQN